MQEEKQISEELSSLVNKAYSTLLDPLNRGLYMLKLHNITIPEGTTSVDPEFLMDIMEINEEVESASKDREKAIELIAQNKKVLEELTR